MPVVQAGPLDRLVADVKAQGLDEMQPGPGHRACARDIPRILGDLWLKQHDIEHPVSPSRLLLGQRRLLYSKTALLSM